MKNPSQGFKDDVAFVIKNNPGECYMEYAKIMRQMSWRNKGGIYWLMKGIEREHKQMLATGPGRKE